MKKEEAALNLSTKKLKRPGVSIDGAVYEIALAEDFKLREFLWLETKGTEVMQSLAKGYSNLDNGEFEKLEALLDEITTKVMIGVPEEVMQRLHDSQKLQIVELFIETVESSQGKTLRSGGLKSFPGSRGSTVERSKAG